MTLFNAQLKAEQLVAQDIYLCQTSLITKMLKEGVIPCDDVEQAYDEAEEDEYSRDILEWWAISERLATRLRMHNEALIDNEYGTWWGRTTSGQAIYMDSVIEAIAEEVYSS